MATMVIAEVICTKPMNTYTPNIVENHFDRGLFDHVDPEKTSS